MKHIILCLKYCIHCNKMTNLPCLWRRIKIKFIRYLLWLWNYETGRRSVKMEKKTNVTKIKIVQLIAAFIGFVLYVVCFSTPAWILYSVDTDSVTAGLFQMCVGESGCRSVAGKGISATIYWWYLLFYWFQIIIIKFHIKKTLKSPTHKNMSNILVGPKYIGIGLLHEYWWILPQVEYYIHDLASAVNILRGHSTQ